MPKTLIPLAQLPIGKHGRVHKLMTTGQVRKRMLDLGFVTDTIVEALYTSPLGDPIAYEIRGTVIALRSEEASTIWVEVNDT